MSSNSATYVPALCAVFECSNINSCGLVLARKFKKRGTHEGVRALYFTTNLYTYKNPNEERRSCNDPRIVPKLIDAKKEGLRIGKPWNWNCPPYK